MSDHDRALVERAIQLAIASARNGGGPFGAVVARGGEPVAEGVNGVTRDHDPTAHAEVIAIRAACEKLGVHSLQGFDLYASCQPCPMCLAASMWARLDRVMYAATTDDAAAAGFDDARIYDEIRHPAGRSGTTVLQIDSPDARRPFAEWTDNPLHVSY